MSQWLLFKRILCFIMTQDWNSDPDDLVEYEPAGLFSDVEYINWIHDSNISNHSEPKKTFFHLSACPSICSSVHPSKNTSIHFSVRLKPYTNSSATPETALTGRCILFVSVLCCANYAATESLKTKQIVVGVTVDFAKAFQSLKEYWICSVDYVYLLFLGCVWKNELPA